MKLNFGKRLALFLHWLLSLIAAAMAVLFCASPDTIAKLLEKLNLAVGRQKADIIGIAALAVYVLLAVLSAFIIFSNNRKKQRGFITVDSSEAGKTRIAVSAVEQMIRQAVRGVDGITEMKSNIVNLEDAISISTNVIVAGNAHVPTVTLNIQRAIRSYIELNCGVAVREVSVNVHAVETDGDEKRGRRFAPSAPVQTPSVHATETDDEKREGQFTQYSTARAASTFEKTEPVRTEEPTAVKEIEEPESGAEAFDDAPISLTLDPPQELVNENHPIE